jgi:hypothetical protein
MRNVDDLIALVNKSPITFIASPHGEKWSDEFLLNFNYLKIDNLNSSFCFKEFVRNVKIENLLENRSQPNFFLIDIDDIPFDGESLGDQWRQITLILTKLEDGIYESGKNFPNNPEFRILITCSTYDSIREDNHYVSGNKALYMSDLAIVFHQHVAKVVKSRFVKNGENILYSMK